MKPGTDIDDEVTEVRNWDFFLQAHAALQRIAHLCHYYKVHEEIFRETYAKSVQPSFQNIADVAGELT